MIFPKLSKMLCAVVASMGTSYAWMDTNSEIDIVTRPPLNKMNNLLLTFDVEHPRVVRQYVEEDVAHQLYMDLVSVGIPDDDRREGNPDLIKFFEDAGQVMPEELIPPAHEAINHINNNPVGGSLTSFVLRLEYLHDIPYDVSKGLIHDVVPNHILEDGGTIHLYVSSQGAAALANHTDITDIFVLHLDGVKEWLLCEENNEKQGDPLTYKLDTCATYNQMEIDTLRCETIQLHPGDGLFLPMRVVHSARAISNIPSAHITMAFPSSLHDDVGMCQDEYPSNPLVKPKRRLECSRCDEHFIISWSCDNSSCDTCYGDCDGFGIWESCDDSCTQSCDFCLND